MKIFFGLFIRISIAILLFSIPVLSSGSDTIFFSIPKVNAFRGDTVRIPLNISTLLFSDSIYSGDISLSYDTTVVQIFRVEADTLLSHGSSLFFNPVLKKIGFASGIRIVGGGVLVKLVARLRPSATSFSPINFMSVLLNEGGFKINTSNGGINPLEDNLPMFTVTMRDTAIARFDTLRFHYAGVDPDGQVVTFSLLTFPVGATISSAGDLEWSPPLDANGLYNFIVRIFDGTSYDYDTANVNIIRFGDVSGNGTITSFDAGMILRDQVGAITLTPVQIRVGNVSGDFSITSMDASYILQYVVGLINTFPGGLGKISQQNVLLSAFSFKILPSETVGDYDLFVSVNKPSQVFGITMSLRFDSLLIFPKIIKQTELTDSMSMAYFFPKGKANLALAGIKPLNTAGDIAKLTFTLKNSTIARNAVLFTVDKFVLNEKDFANDIGGITLSVNDAAAIPIIYALGQNFPNPFNPATTINYQLPNNSSVNISIYNLLGQLVTTLLNDEQSAGYHSLKWNGTDSFNRTVSSGVYLYKIIAQSRGKNLFVETKKMILLK